jgi:hypothetical protein
VDVALEPAPLLVLGRHDPLPRRAELLDVGAELLGQADVAQHESCLGREIAGEGLLGLRGRLIRRLRERERAEQFAALVHREEEGHLG